MVLYGKPTLLTIPVRKLVLFFELNNGVSVYDMYNFVIIFLQYLLKEVLQFNVIYIDFYSLVWVLSISDEECAVSESYCYFNCLTNISI